jgi:drug/metabolite transporter (DMT)-like permease
MQNAFLYIATILIWGSTWLAIKFQLGAVDPMVSVIYRFGLATLLLILYCRFRKLRLRFSLQEHFFMALLGILLFAFNYWLVYLSEVYVTSGLAAVIMSSMVILNIFNGALFIGVPVRRMMLLGGLVGMLGIGLIFWPEIASFSLTDKGIKGLLFGFASACLGSLGNITSARNQQHGLPVIQTNAYAMGYGTIFLLIVCAVIGKKFDFDFSAGYVFSLGYLAVFGSILAFGFFLTLVGRIGPAKAGYANLLIPVVALTISTFVEGYHWTLQAVIGLGLVLAGNYIMIKKPK